MRKLVIAIDGPAGAGKSTIAKAVAEKIGYAYLDTGAMYRAVTWKFLNSGREYDEKFIAMLAETMRIEFKPEKGVNRVYGDGEEITEVIRTAEVTKLVSPVAAIAGVRKAMVDQQRKLGANGGVILDGRDIGTVVFPNADIKIFLTASVTARAERRYREMVAKGIVIDMSQVKNNIEQRDLQDSTRAVGPLKKADDAYVLDSTNMTVAEVRDLIVKMIAENAC